MKRLRLPFFSIFPVLFLLSGSAQAALRVGVVLDKGGRDDKSFNAAAVRGAEDAKKKLGIDLKIVEASDDNAYEPLLRSLATKKYDIIFAIGISQRDALAKVSKQFPEQKFAIIDAEILAGNVRSLLFEEHEGSYLVGAIAAMKTKTGKIGFVGGMEIPLIKRFEMGYRAGAQKVNPKIQVVANYVGISSDAWNNPPRAKELALAQSKAGVDVIFSAAGASNFGVFDAVEERKIYAIGVDSNQNFVKPGFILTSMLKRVDVAVLRTIDDLNAGKFETGVTRFGLKNDGIDYAVDEYNRNLLTDKDLQEVQKLKQKILKAEISVPDYYKTSKH